MRILGIDPGIGRCGWAVIEIEGQKLTVKDYGCIETEAKIGKEKRLEIVHKEILRLIKKYSPEVMAIEELFFGNNAKTAFMVGEARGVILLCASQSNLPVSIYNPMEIKVALTGYGKALKPQVGQMVKVLLKLKEVPKPDDTADALAVAITHAFSKKYA
ncbi:MAG: crossover junction endodeoxyribonuclease RuvC [Candidatus Levybacteria bacterium]|nr:crossover junction endodeoxyribonuclease RuvC [Candidatus Levybacteria bacterium]